MAIAYNVAGSTTFASAGWSDATGFANDATLVVANAGGPITAGLDQKATNIDYLEVLSAFSADIGDPTNPLQFEANGATTDYFRYRPSGGRCWVYAKDGTGDAKIENLDVGGSGRIYLLGGEFEDVTQDGGHIDSGPNATTDNFYAYGGTSRWQVHGTALTLARIAAGTHTIERAVTTLTINAGASVVLNAPGLTVTTLNMNGGTLLVKAGTIATVVGDAGVIDCSQAERAIVLGSTSFVQGGVRVIKNANTTVSNITTPAKYLQPIPL